MTIEELFKIIDERIYKPGHYLVHLRQRYSDEKEWTEYNILLEFDQFSCGYVWDWDFNEGQEFVEVLGFIDTDDLEVPDYNSPEHRCENCRFFSDYHRTCVRDSHSNYISNPDEKTCEAWKERDE